MGASDIHCRTNDVCFIWYGLPHLPGSRPPRLCAVLLCMQKRKCKTRYMPSLCETFQLHTGSWADMLLLLKVRCPHCPAAQILHWKMLSRHFHSQHPRCRSTLGACSHTLLLWNSSVIKWHCHFIVSMLTLMLLYLEHGSVVPDALYADLCCTCYAHHKTCTEMMLQPKLNWWTEWLRSWPYNSRNP